MLRRSEKGYINAHIFIYVFIFQKQKFLKIPIRQTVSTKYNICCPILNSRSTGADDDKEILYLKNIFFTLGKFTREHKSFDFDF